MPAEIRAWLAAALDLRLTGNEPIRVLEARYHFSMRRTLVVRYVLLDEGLGRGR